MARYKFNPDWRSPPGDTIREMLKERGWSHEDLAQVLGVSRSTVGRLVSGKLKITEAWCGHLEAAFGVPRSFWRNRETDYRKPASAPIRGGK